MQRLEVSDAVRPLYGSLGIKGLINPLRHSDNYSDYLPTIKLNVNEIMHSRNPIFFSVYIAY